MKKICGIYKITSPSKKIYIGQSTNIKNRWRKYKNLSCKSQLHLFNSLKKYGVKKHKFEIIHQCEENELNDLEKYYIELYQCLNHKTGLNSREGGGSGGKWSDELKIRFGKMRKGIKFTKKWRKNLSISRKGKKFTKKHKKRISIALKGRNFSVKTKKKLSIALKKRMQNVSDEYRNKMSISLMGNQHLLGHKHSEETKNKIRNKLRQKKGRKVIKFDENKNQIALYNSIKETSESNNISYDYLQKVLRGERKSKTYLFKYAS